VKRQNAFIDAELDAFYRREPARRRSAHRIAAE
jgi:hypothetical protein